MGTELARRGVDTGSTLWSAAALRDHPDVVAQLHEAYFRAGADVATTNTYQASMPAFMATGLSESESAALIASAVRIARNARDAVNRAGFVAGSIGPWGAYLADGSEYTGDYVQSAVAYEDFHRPRIRILLDAGVDVLALETMPNAAELYALASLVADEFPDAVAWVGLSVRDAAHLRDGTHLHDVAVRLRGRRQIIALGVNCTDMATLGAALETLRGAWNGPLVAYPNLGGRYDPVAKHWSGEGIPPRFANEVARWIAMGVALVGGCCGTGPSDIRALAQNLGRSIVA